MKVFLLYQHVHPTQWECLNSWSRIRDPCLRLEVMYFIYTKSSSNRNIWFDFYRDQSALFAYSSPYLYPVKHQNILCKIFNLVLHPSFEPLVLLLPCCFWMQTAHPCRVPANVLGFELQVSVACCSMCHEYQISCASLFLCPTYQTVHLRERG